VETKFPLDQLVIVVPIGEGETAHLDLLESLGALGPAVEVIFSGIRDPDEPTSQAIVERAPRWRWIHGPRGRGAQINRAVFASSRPFIWVLHADSRFDRSTGEAVIATLRTPRHAIGFLRLRFIPGGPPLVTLNALGAWWRSRYLKLPFGDQGLLFSRSVYEAVGGFPESVQRGEDLLFVRRARAQKIPIEPMPGAILTSARRYTREGWLLTTIRNVGLTARRLVTR